VPKDTSKVGQEFIIPNPSVDPKTHAVNPSAPTTGTEGGTADDERRTLPGAEPSATHQGHDRTFRCADVGNADCRWETSGASDDEIIEQARDHAQTEHGWHDWTDALRSRVRDAIRNHRAA
jgi:predicted small metal-binding protein